MKRCPAQGARDRASSCVYLKDELVRNDEATVHTTKLSDGGVQAISLALAELLTHDRQLVSCLGRYSHRTGRASAPTEQHRSEGLSHTTW